MRQVLYVPGLAPVIAFSLFGSDGVRVVTNAAFEVGDLKLRKIGTAAAPANPASGLGALPVNRGRTYESTLAASDLAVGGVYGGRFEVSLVDQTATPVWADEVVELVPEPGVLQGGLVVAGATPTTTTFRVSPAPPALPPGTVAIVGTTQVEVETYNAGTGDLTLGAALPGAPAIGDEVKFLRGFGLAATAGDVAAAVAANAVVRDIQAKAGAASSAATTAAGAAGTAASAAAAAETAAEGLPSAADILSTIKGDADFRNMLRALGRKVAIGAYPAAGSGGSVTIQFYNANGSAVEATATMTVDTAHRTTGMTFN